MDEQPPALIEYQSSEHGPLRDSEYRNFWIAVPAAIGILLAGLLWTITYYFHL